VWCHQSIYGNGQWSLRGKSCSVIVPTCFVILFDTVLQTKFYSFVLSFLARSGRLDRSLGCLYEGRVTRKVIRPSLGLCGRDYGWYSHRGLTYDVTHSSSGKGGGGHGHFAL
jgi:hypothetical protein